MKQLQKVAPLINNSIHQLSRNYVTTIKPKELINSSVIISTSDNIFRNLSLEDWLYNQYPLIKINQSSSSSPSWYHLLLWVNQPCVVIGRHQNPWNEVKINRCQSLGLPIARRNSGGGTVVHDLGNLNLCFLSDRKSYNRRRNNQLIIKTLKKHYGIECEISDRENLITRNGGFKISGTASKLSSKSAYHHCTLLVNVNLNLMSQVIRTNSSLFENKATPSVHASVENLSTICSTLHMSDLVKNISTEFCQEFGDNQKIVKVDPRKEVFENIDKIEQKLKDWSWIFGKTPKFEINYHENDLGCKIIVNHGLIENIETSPTIDWSMLSGVRFTKEDVLAKLVIYEDSAHPNYVQFKTIIFKLIDQVYS